MRSLSKPVLNKSPYPPIKPDKGMLGGSCNRTACQAPGAFYAHKYNHDDYYCLACAYEINRACGEMVVIIPEDV